LGLKRQQDREKRALTRSTLYPDLATMFLDDPLGDSQAKADTHILGGKVGLEYLGDVLFPDTAPLIGEGQPNLAFFFIQARSQRDDPAIVHGLDGIAEEVENAVAQKLLVDP